MKLYIVKIHENEFQVSRDKPTWDAENNYWDADNGVEMCSDLQDILPVIGPMEPEELLIINVTPAATISRAVTTVEIETRQVKVTDEE